MNATNQLDLSAYRNSGARVQTEAGQAGTSQDPSSQLLTYEQFLLIHQARAGEGQQQSQSMSADCFNSSSVSRNTNANATVFRSDGSMVQPGANSSRVWGTTGLRQAGMEDRDGLADMALGDRATTMAQDVRTSRDLGRNLQDFPTLQTLNQTAHIQDRVQTRYQELERAASHNKGTVQDLVDITGLSKHKKSKEKGLWPQEHVFIGPQRRRPTYDQLDEQV